jgi:hypothetical protein
MKARTNVVTMLHAFDIFDVKFAVPLGILWAHMDNVRVELGPKVSLVTQFANHRAVMPRRSRSCIDLHRAVMPRRRRVGVPASIFVGGGVL